MARDLIPSDATIKAIKPGDPRQRLSDGDGLYLRLFVKGGSHGWRLDYTIHGKRKNLSLGTYPNTGLALARRKAHEARQLVSQGVDPSDARKADKAAKRRAIEAEQLADAGLPPADSFEAIAREWMATIHGVKVSDGHADRTRIRLEQDIFPWIGRRPMAEIDAPELLLILRQVTERGAIETAHRLKDACGQVFRYGIATGVCSRNPAADLRDALPPVPTAPPRSRGRPEARRRVAARAMSDYAGHPVTRAALALSALLLLRPGELRQMEWAWIDFDAATVTIPGKLMKRKKADKANGAPHLVPLAPQALVILRELLPVTGGEGRRYVFQSLLTGERPMSENTVNTALRRLGFDRETATAHGFRAMARTMAAERLGIDAQIIEAQLAHAVPDALGRAYNRTTFAEQRRELMVKWADYLDRLRKGADVVPFKAA